MLYQIILTGKKQNKKNIGMVMWNTEGMLNVIAIREIPRGTFGHHLICTISLLRVGHSDF